MKKKRWNAYILDNLWNHHLDLFFAEILVTTRDLHPMGLQRSSPRLASHWCNS